MAKGKGKDKKGADADEGATDKKLKPANFVKVRHSLCEKQSKVGEMIAAPIKTQFGHHLILCEGRKQKL